MLQKGPIHASQKITFISRFSAVNKLLKELFSNTLLLALRFQPLKTSKKSNRQNEFSLFFQWKLLFWTWGGWASRIRWRWKIWSSNCHSEHGADEVAVADRKNLWIQRTEEWYLRLLLETQLINFQWPFRWLYEMKNRNRKNRMILHCASTAGVVLN